ncbi:MAG TPA: hypothetical protein VIX17_11660 [Pyrinomonadaceae bacterium]|jgi:hypothetical protein
MGYAGEAMNELHGTDVFTEDNRTSSGYGFSELTRDMGRDLRKSKARIKSNLVLQEVAEELENAKATHAPMNGHHEGYAVILEELDELWAECKSNTHAKNTPEAERPALREAKRQRMRKEAIQVAAMAIRFIEDVCDK